MLLDVSVFGGIPWRKKRSDVAAVHKRYLRVQVSLAHITMSGQYSESAPTYLYVDCQLKFCDVVKKVGRESKIVPKVPAVL